MAALPLLEFRRLDLNSEELGVSIHSLMARAGQALADAVEPHAAGGPVVFLCGKGNNGGDGFAAASILLRRNIDCVVVLMEPLVAIKGASTQAFLELLPESALKQWSRLRRKQFESAPVVVDCLLGSGVEGKPRAPYDAAIKWINGHKGRIISCDLPSGFASPLSVRPDETVTFHAQKAGMTESNSGFINVAPIGIPSRAETDIGFGDLAIGYPKSAPTSHKGDNGRVLVVGGGPFLGAPYYAGLAAYRAGADLVHIVTPHDAATALRNWGPDLLIHDAGPGDHLTMEAVPVVSNLLERVDSIIIGPGLGTYQESIDAARAIIEKSCTAGKMVVVDADGLDAIDAGLLKQFGHQLVLTPHGREFKDLSRLKPTAANVTKYAAKNGVTVLCKGAEDTVSDGTITRSCHRGNATMTVGGTGDLLAGVVGAILARGSKPFAAACASSYLLGRAGEVSAKEFGAGATAMDMTPNIARVLALLE